MLQFVHDQLSDDEVAAQAEQFTPLTQSVRELIDAVIRTEADDATIAAARADIERVVASLSERQMPGSYGMRVSTSGTARAWGNVVMGLRNPMAPPLDIHRDADGVSTASFHLGAAFEGPPGLVHGGVASLVLDHLLGHAAGFDRRPRMTTTLTMHYRRKTPLGPLQARAHIERMDGTTAHVVGHIAEPDGRVTVEAEGTFVLPRWVRELEELSGDDGPRFA
ncbi:PaaI family thioesterase [Nocardioides pacificus]